MPKHLHISLKIELHDDDWGTEKAAIKPLYDQFSQALTAAGIVFVDETKTLESRPRKPKLEAVPASPPVAA